METRIFSKICWTTMSQRHSIQNNFTSQNFDGDENLWQNLPGTCLKDVVFKLSSIKSYELLEIWGENFTSGDFETPWLEARFSNLSGWKWRRVLYNVWSSFFGSESVRKEATISADTISETPLSGKHWHWWWGGPSLPFSQFLFHRCFCPAVLIVLQFPLLVFHPSSKWGSLMRKQTPRPPSLSPLWQKPLYNLPNCAVFLNLVLIHTSTGWNTYIRHNT